MIKCISKAMQNIKKTKTHLHKIKKKIINPLSNFMYNAIPLCLLVVALLFSSLSIQNKRGINDEMKKRRLNFIFKQMRNLILLSNVKTYRKNLFDW
jgi:ribosomal 50S subunit-associated protein YjgA (DUF615 family)